MSLSKKKNMFLIFLVSPLTSPEFFHFVYNPLYQSRLIHRYIVLKIILPQRLGPVSDSLHKVIVS